MQRNHLDERYANSKETLDAAQEALKFFSMPKYNEKIELLKKQEIKFAAEARSIQVEIDAINSHEIMKKNKKEYKDIKDFLSKKIQSLKNAPVQDIEAIKKAEIDLNEIELPEKRIELIPVEARVEGKVLFEKIEKLTHSLKSIQEKEKTFANQVSKFSNVSNMADKSDDNFLKSVYGYKVKIQQANDEATKYRNDIRLQYDEYQKQVNHLAEAERNSVSRLSFASRAWNAIKDFSKVIFSPVVSAVSRIAHRINEKWGNWLPFDDVNSNKITNPATIFRSMRIGIARQSARFSAAEVNYEKSLEKISALTNKLNEVSPGKIRLSVNSFENQILTDMKSSLILPIEKTKQNDIKFSAEKRPVFERHTQELRHIVSKELQDLLGISFGVNTLNPDKIVIDPIDLSRVVGISLIDREKINSMIEALQEFKSWLDVSALDAVKKITHIDIPSKTVEIDITQTTVVNSDLEDVNVDDVEMNSLGSDSAYVYPVADDSSSGVTRIYYEKDESFNDSGLSPNSSADGNVNSGSFSYDTNDPPVDINDSHLPLEGAMDGSSEIEDNRNKVVVYDYEDEISEVTPAAIIPAENTVVDNTLTSIQDHIVVIHDDEDEYKNVISNVAVPSESVQTKLDKIFNDLSMSDKPPKDKDEKIEFCIGQREKSQHIADELYAISRSLFLAIPSMEFLKSKDEKVNLYNESTYVNHLSLGIEKDISQQKSIDGVLFAMERWIMVMERCHKKEDFHTLQAIIGAFDSPAVYRLFNEREGGLKLYLSTMAQEQFAKIEPSVKKVSMRKVSDHKGGVPYVGDLLSRIEKNEDKKAAIADVQVDLLKRQEILSKSSSTPPIKNTHFSPIKFFDKESEITKMSRKLWKVDGLKPTKIDESLERVLWNHGAGKSFRNN
jgi:hypothetical protein